MVYFACTNKLNCSAERERGDGGRLQFQLPRAWWSFTKNILNSFSRIHNDPRRSKVKYHEFWQLHWQRSWAQSEGCVCVAGSWKFELVCLGLSDMVCSGSWAWEPFSNHTLSPAQRSSSDLPLNISSSRANFIERDLGKTRLSILGSDGMMMTQSYCSPSALNALDSECLPNALWVIISFVIL